MSSLKQIKTCLVCGSDRIVLVPVLWESLINQWRISAYEVDYVNCQQGLLCLNCHNNLRSMALAMAVMRCFSYKGLLKDFVKQKHIHKLHVLEINEAGNLTLSECCRVLKSDDFCSFTIPMIVDRVTISREGLPPSYHGSGEEKSDLLVYTEYGCDAWKHVIKAGFQECRIFSLEYPSAQALVAVK